MSLPHPTSPARHHGHVTTPQSGDLRYGPPSRSRGTGSQRERRATPRLSTISEGSRTPRSPRGLGGSLVEMQPLASDEYNYQPPIASDLSSGLLNDHRDPRSGSGLLSDHHRDPKSGSGLTESTRQRVVRINQTAEFFPGDPKKEVHVGEPPTPCLRFTGRNPGRACCLACAGFCFPFVLMILILMTTSGFLVYHTDVPLYLRDHITKRRSDAVEEGKEVADATIGEADIQLQRSLDELDDTGELLVLELIYLPKSGDVFELGVLQDVRKIERRIMQQTGFESHCYIEYSSADRQRQEDAAESGNYAEIIAINERATKGEITCAPPKSLLWACTPGAASCGNVSSNPIGLLDCARTDGLPCDPLSDTAPNGMVLSDKFKTDKIASYVSTPPLIVCPNREATCPGKNAYEFLKLVDAGFSASNTVGQAFRSEFRFGLPLSGYKQLDDREDDQKKELEDWIWDTYHEFLQDASTDRVEVLYTGYGMLEKFLQTIIAKDGAFALGAMIFVLVYMAFMTQSWWLAFLGMGGILMSFPPAYFLYYLVFQQRYFGVFNVMTIFIILGIGADDIFVLLDTWDRSRHELAEGTTWQDRLTWTWRHAAKAMLITSFTTMISFLANASSSFPAIRTFGIFAALLVFVNYLGVIFYYPTVIAVYETGKNKEKQFCCGCPAAISAKVNEGLRLDRPNLRDFKVAMVDGVESLVYSPSTEGKANKWFREAYANMVMGMNSLIVLTFLVFFVLMTIAALGLEVDPEQPKLLPDSQNYQRFRDIKPEYFKRGGSDISETVEFVWGIQQDPIDRDGTRDTDMDNLGKPNWDTGFRLPVAVDCISEICAKAQIKDDKRKTSPDYRIDCLALEFKEWAIAKVGQAKYDSVTGLDYYLKVQGNTSEFYGLFVQWFGDPEIYSKWKPHLYAEDLTKASKEVKTEVGCTGTERCVVPRFVTAELTLTVTTEIPPSDGINLFNEWEEWMKQQYAAGPDDGRSCRSVIKYANGWQNTMGFSFVRDKLAAEAISGIMLSIVLAFVVLGVATGNVIVALYATLTITAVVVCAMGVTVMMGWKLGVLESIAFVMVPGMSVDFVAHMADAYLESKSAVRGDRVRDMLGNVGISVVSGAFSTLGATLFLFLPTVVFFNKFGTMIFVTIGLSLLWALVFFPALLSTPLGPQGTTGDWHGPLKRLLGRGQQS